MPYLMKDTRSRVVDLLSGSFTERHPHLTYVRVSFSFWRTGELQRADDCAFVVFYQSTSLTLETNMEDGDCIVTVPTVEFDNHPFLSLI